MGMISVQAEQLNQRQMAWGWRKVRPRRQEQRLEVLVLLLKLKFLQQQSNEGTMYPV
jgi:hypothetical protein